MTLYSPVVVTEDQRSIDVALSRGWHVVRRYPGSIKVLTITGNDVLCGIPTEGFSLTDGTLDASHTPVWNYVLDWIDGHVLRPMLIVEAGDDFTDLALWAASSRGWPIGALMTRIPEFDAQTVALLNSADGAFLPNDAVANDLAQAWPHHVAHLADAPMVPIEPSRPIPPRTRRQGLTKVLVVAHDAGSATDEASRRAQQWRDALQPDPEVDVEFALDIATAAAWPGMPERTHRVPDLGAANWVREGETLDKASHRLSHGDVRPFPVTRQVAGTWNQALERYFAGRAVDHYDVVILTGPPWFFDFAAYAKKNWYAATVLDYLTPLPDEGRSAWSDEAIDDARYLQRGWNMSASVVTVPTEDIAQKIEPGGPESRIEVVPTTRDAALLMASLVRELGDHSFSHPFP